MHHSRALLALLVLAVGACSTPRPVLYPNLKYAETGQEAAQVDIDECVALAKEFDRIVSDDGLLLMLHHLDADEHPALANPDHGSAGDGVLLFFQVADVLKTYERAREMKAHVIDEPHMNELAGQLEFSLRDPDGYALTICRHESA